MAKTKSDLFTNLAFGTVQMSAVDTLTFNLIQFGVGIFQGVAMILHRILYFPSVASVRELVANNDEMHIALTTSNRLASITDVSQPAIIDRKSIISKVGGAAYNELELPLMQDFTRLPGGGKLVACNPIYAAMSTAGAAAASQCTIRLDMTFKELSDAEYLELIQSQYPANVT